MHGVTTRLPRVAHEAIIYKKWTIPAKVCPSIFKALKSSPFSFLTLYPMQTPVSESNYFVHMDPTIFPQPDAFLPSRWIEAKEKGIGLERYLVSFSKGSRQCVGIKYAPHPPSSRSKTSSHTPLPSAHFIISPYIPIPSASNPSESCLLTSFSPQSGLRRTLSNPSNDYAKI